MNVLFDVLFYTKDAQAQIEAGVPSTKLDSIENMIYKGVLLEVDRVESAAASRTIKNHTELTMYSGDVWVVKYSLDNYSRLVEHIDAGKFICKLNN